MKTILILTTTSLVFSACSSNRTDNKDGQTPPVVAVSGGSSNRQVTPTTGTFAIDLETTLRLAAGRNLELATAATRATRADIRADRANLSLLPVLSVGAGFARQNGLLQASDGTPITADRRASNFGLGAGVLGAGPTLTPGLSLDLSVERIFFDRLAARQDQQAAQAAERATAQRVLAEAAQAYYELLRARSHLELARELEFAGRQLAEATRNFAKAGEGLEADAERALAESLLRRNRTTRAEADLIRHSSNLARILHLPPSLTLIP